MYNTNSEIAERAVRGEYNAQYINMVIISHNDNDLIRAPGTGKNVVTVGAVKDGNYPDTAITSCGGLTTTTGRQANASASATSDLLILTGTAR